MKKEVIVNVDRKNLVYGKKTGVTLNEARNAFMAGFLENAKKKALTKYKNIDVIRFKFK